MGNHLRASRSLISYKFLEQFRCSKAVRVGTEFQNDLIDSRIQSVSQCSSPVAALGASDNNINSRITFDLNTTRTSNATNENDDEWTVVKHKIPFSRIPISLCTQSIQLKCIGSYACYRRSFSRRDRGACTSSPKGLPMSSKH